ncbi:MAG: hypothetical protein JWP35_1936 [Caulobacter sp.]|nr:hypothetical protein [Caulobacter sp.]
MSMGLAGLTPYPPRRQAYYTAFIVFTVTLFSFLDRQVLAILVDPIRHELHATDTGMSLLYGFAFVFLYSTLGIPIGRLIDRKQRRLILAAGVAVWSLATIACGLAQDYWTLFGARMCVGIGEACLTPAACSLLADCFQPRVRGRAMSFYLMGVYGGIGLSMMMGGLLYDVLLHSSPLPLIGGLTPWRQIFIIIGAPGLAISALVLTMKEPDRQDVAPLPVAGADPLPPAPDLLAYMRANLAVIATVLLAHGLLAFVSYGLMGWAPSVLMREFHQTRGVVGLTLGLLSLAGGIVGALSGSFICDRWTAGGVKAAKFKVCAVGAGLAGVGLAILPFAATPWVAVAAITLCITALPFASASGQTMVQELFPNRLRGQGSAMTVLMIGLFGAGGGPLVVGLLSDHVFGKAGLSMAIVSAALPAAAVVIVLYLVGRNGYEALRGRVLPPEPAPVAAIDGGAMPLARPA